RRHDGGLVPVPARRARARLEPDHQRSARCESRRVRYQLKTAGHDRVGVTGTSGLGTGDWGLGREAIATVEGSSVLLASRPSPESLVPSPRSNSFLFEELHKFACGVN